MTFISKLKHKLLGYRYVLILDGTRRIISRVKRDRDNRLFAVSLWDSPELYVELFDSDGILLDIYSLKPMTGPVKTFKVNRVENRPNATWEWLTK